METTRSVSRQPATSHDSTSEQSRACEQRRIKEEPSPNRTEPSRIITDPATGTCYCRGKVLGKVRSSRFGSSVQMLLLSWSRF